MARRGYNAKIKKYSKWDHDEHIIPLAIYSAGAIALKSAAFINKLYTSVDDDDVKREWNSESERLRLKKFFIDSLSMAIAKQRVRDIRVMRNVARFCLMITHTIRLMKEEQIYVLERLVTRNCELGCITSIEFLF